MGHPFRGVHNVPKYIKYISSNAPTGEFPTNLKLSLVRNSQMDNRLSFAQSTSLTISSSNSSAKTITVNNLPDYQGFDTSGWIIMRNTTNTGDPGVTGDYLYNKFCTINRSTRTITINTTDMTPWTTNNVIILYNPFLNYSLPGSQDVAAFVPKTPNGTWRSYQTYPGPLFKHSDGRYINLFIGFSGPSGPTYIGYMQSTDQGTTWQIGNNGNYVYSCSSYPDLRFAMLNGSAFRLNDGSGRYYCPYVFIRNSNSRNEARLLYFNEDLTQFSISDLLISDNFSLGSVVKMEDQYYLSGLYINPLGSAYRSFDVYKSANLLGPYTLSQRLVDGASALDATAWAALVGVPILYSDNTYTFGLFDGTADMSGSGTKANRELSAASWDSTTKLWSIHRHGPVILNPMYYYNINGAYSWYTDHGGPCACINRIDNKYFISTSFRGLDTYNAALLQLKI